jgi:hypothetical protein
MKRDTTNPTVATIVSLRLSGIAVVIFAAAVPIAVLVWAFNTANDWDLVLAPVAWAAVAAISWVVLHRTPDARTLVTLVCGCCALWTVALGGPPLYAMRDARGAFLLVAFLVTCASITGASFGYVCFIRYRGLPPSLKGAVRLATLAAMPAFALFLVANVVQMMRPQEHGHGWSAAGSAKEFLLVLVAPFVFALIVSMVSIETGKRGLTKPSPIA